MQPCEGAARRWSKLQPPQRLVSCLHALPTAARTSARQVAHEAGFVYALVCSQATGWRDGPCKLRALTVHTCKYMHMYGTKNPEKETVQAWFALNPQRFERLLPASWDDLALVSGWVLIF